MHQLHPLRSLAATLSVSGNKRLPSQSESFREAAASMPPPMQNLLFPPRGPRDNGMEGKPTNMTATVPSGPRHGIPPRPALDIHNLGSGAPHRVPLSGPTAAAPSDFRRSFAERQYVGEAFYTDKGPEAMDIDSPKSTRYPPSRFDQGPPKDRHGHDDPDGKQSLPTGPRAMATRISGPPSLNAPNAPPTPINVSHGPNVTPYQQAAAEDPDRNRMENPPILPRSQKPSRWGIQTEQTQTNSYETTKGSMQREHPNGREFTDPQRVDERIHFSRQSPMEPPPMVQV